MDTATTSRGGGKEDRANKENDSPNDSILQQTTQADTTPGGDEKADTQLQRLGTANSHMSISPARQIAVMVLMTLTQLCQMYPFGLGIGSGLSIANSLRTHDQHASQVIPPSALAEVEFGGGWIAASYPLTSGTFVLIGGRLGEVYGHKAMLTLGCVWWVIWQLASGFAPNLVVLCLFRGLAGAGGGFMVPNAVALIGITMPPGKKRNLAFGMFGAMAPVGAAGGTAVATLFVQLTEWKWAFFFGAMIGTVIYSTVLWFIPSDTAADRKGKIDWLGAYLGVGGLILFNFVWNQAPGVGWPTSYVYALLIVSLVHITSFAIWESRWASSPILPFDIWTAPSFGLLMVTVFFSFMSMGIFLWYTTLLCITVRGNSILLTAAYYQPLTIGGTAAAFLSAWLVPRIPAQYIVAIGNAALIISNALVATVPASGQTYWAQIFPALFISSFSIDFIFAASQVIASGSVSRKRQGVAASLVGTLLTYGLSTGLGFAGTVETYTNGGGEHLRRGYANANWLGVGLGGIGMVLALAFLRVPKSTQEGVSTSQRNVDDNDITQPLTLSMRSI
ncbi:hypothetical protein LTR15_003485 [Elasticomyces elasticus]|nr:hypothetical protein LTR15_003485 [Elasticomyces elasticus]